MVGVAAAADLRHWQFSSIHRTTRKQRQRQVHHGPHYHHRRRHRHRCMQKLLRLRRQTKKMPTATKCTKEQLPCREVPLPACLHVRLCARRSFFDTWFIDVVLLRCAVATYQCVQQQVVLPCTIPLAAQGSRARPNRSERGCERRRTLPCMGTTIVMGTAM